jgi:hypothetical protein
VKLAGGANLARTTSGEFWVGGKLWGG